MDVAVVKWELLIAELIKEMIYESKALLDSVNKWPVSFVRPIVNDCFELFNGTLSQKTSRVVFCKMVNILLHFFL